VPILRAYLTFWLIRSIVEIGDAATSALGRPDIRFVIDLIQLPFFIIGIWVGLQVWGDINGIAWSLVIVRIIAGLVYFIVTLRTMRVTAGDIRRCLLPTSLAGLLMAVIVYTLRSANLLQQWSLNSSFLKDLLNLSFLILAGIVSYFVILYLLDRSGFKAVATMASQILLPETLKLRFLALRHRRLMRP
jgi:hypothetical protein